MVSWSAVHSDETNEPVEQVEQGLHTVFENGVHEAAA